MKVTKPVNLTQLQRELAAASVATNGLGSLGTDVPGELDVHQFNQDNRPTELPPEAFPVVEAHVAAPPAIEYSVATTIDAVLRTTDDAEHDVFVIPAETKSVYRAELTMSAIDAGSGATKTMTGILVWKRLLGVDVIAPPQNITLLSDIHDTAAAGWVMNGLPSGSNFRIFVKGAAGRTIDWFLSGPVGRFAPEGLDA